MATKIEWVMNADGTKGETWNPVTGCTPISEGCANCYAKRMARSLAGRYGYPDYPNEFDVTLHHDRLSQPIRWKKARRVFVCSMSDFWHSAIPLSFQLQVYRVMEQCPQHTFMILTKRPGQAAMLDYVGGLPELANVWHGTTAENQHRFRERWYRLKAIAAAVVFVSAEPLLGPIWLPHDPDEHPDWVIVGAETGLRARPMDLEWARSLRDQCNEAGIPFFFKRDSNGNRLLDGRLWEEYPKEAR